MKLDYPWHNLSATDVLEKLKSSKKGLSSDEVKSRQEEFGLNQLSGKKQISRWKILIDQFKSPMIYILLIASGITLVLKEYTDSIVIFAAVFVSVMFGFWEENKTSNTLEKLKNILRTKATVLRDGQPREVWQEEIVPGDIVLISHGGRVPADGRIVEALDLSVSEAILTGEWLPAKKRTKNEAKNTPLADRDNMVYAGTLVESGQGKFVVTATGNKTETGKISQILEDTEEEKTPLQRRLAKLGSLLAEVFVVLCAIVFVGGIWRGGGAVEMFEAAIAIAVAGIPEAMPITMTVVLAIGMERILKRKGLVRRLSSVETLGSTSVICCDKTLTLTEGKMSMNRVITRDEDNLLKDLVPQKEGIDKNKDLYKLLKLSSLANEAYVENSNDDIENWEVRGAPTDRALLSGPLALGISKVDFEKDLGFIDRLPFEAVNRFQLVAYAEDGHAFLAISGAPEDLLKRASSIETNDGPKDITEADRKYFNNKLTELADGGFRVIGLAYVKKEDLAKKDFDHKELAYMVKDINFVGVVALKDPLRPDVKESIAIANKAGVRVVIATGDHKRTAKAVGKEIGLDPQDNEIMEGVELDELSNEEFAKIVKKIKIFARVEPKHKMRIISAWQSYNQIVAMTGDGVNDAPALKKAEIGLALGSGTEVAKEAADLILLNDSFSIIVKAIEQGRIILDNIRKSISYVLTDSLTALILIGFTKIIFGWPLPILPAQVLWNNLVEDAFPSIAYAFEPGEKGVMDRKPNPSHTSLFTKEMKALIFITGIINQFIALGIFWYMWKIMGQPIEYVRTIIFGKIAIDTAFVIFSYKNLRKNIWQINPFSNKMLNWAAVSVFFLFGITIYIEPLRNLLSTVVLDWKDWLIICVASMSSMILIEITKWIFIVRNQTEE